MSRSVLSFCLVVAVTIFANAQETDIEDLHTLVDEALSNNPEISAALSKMEMTEQLVPQAGALEDPEVTFKLMEIPGFQFNNAMYANVALEQMIPYPSKLSTRREIASLQSEHAHHEHGEKALDVVTQLKSIYAMLWFSRVSLQFNSENQKLLQQMLQIGQTQYSTGKGSQQEVLRTTIELERLKTEEESLHEEIAKAEAMLRATLNRPNDAKIGPVQLPPFEPMQLTLDELLSFAKQHRPMLIHDSLSAVESSLRISLMKQEYIPDFKISLEYVTYPGQYKSASTWTAMAGITIPFAPWTLGKASGTKRRSDRRRTNAAVDICCNGQHGHRSCSRGHANVKALENKVSSLNKTIFPSR